MTTPNPEAPEGGKAPTLAEVITFLLGEGPLDGVWFGDRHPTKKGAFWWRKYLRAVAEGGKAQSSVERDAARYDWLRNFRNFAQVDAMLDTTAYNTLDAAVDAAMGNAGVDVPEGGKTE